MNDKITVTLTSDQARYVLKGLDERLLETSRYLSPFVSRDDYPKPTDMDTCCDGHRAKYEKWRSDTMYLFDRRDEIQAVIDKIEAEINKSEQSNGSAASAD